MVVNSAAHHGDRLKVETRLKVSRSIAMLFNSEAPDRKGSIAGCEMNDRSQIVTFVDHNLDAAIRDIISKPVGAICTRELKQITSLCACRRNIENLSGLEYCYCLKELELWCNQIYDISPLAELTKLKELDLGLNKITDVSPLASLFNLESLSLFGNNVTDISSLSALKKLKRIDLAYNDIIDLSPLASSVNLVSLEIWLNEIQGTSSLNGLANLKEFYINDRCVQGAGL